VRTGDRVHNPWLRAGHPLVIAHRGQSVDAPENTLEAYRRAADLGADMIEADVGMTRDGVLVMMHDANVNRTTNGRGDVRDLMLDEVRRLDAGKWFGSEFAGLSVPTTEETLALAHQLGVMMCFEAKGGSAGESAEIAIALARLLARSDFLDRGFVAAFEHSALAAAKRDVPNLLIAPERLPDEAPCRPEEAVLQAADLDAPVLQSHHRLLTNELVETLHGAGIAIWSWPTSEPESIAASVAVHADGLMGDDVSMMIAVRNESLGQRPGHGP
jgi:glycerophosphoryl diester phosphodiesterase